MDKETLRRVQMIQLEIAKEIARVCDLNGIKYFLTDGTLLGAVRHKGFIPWDDDMDIGMLRNDYENFLRIAPECLNEKYKLIEWKTDKYYPHPMGKVIKMGTVYKESKRNDSGEQGIWVDVFPYDCIQNFEIKSNVRLFKMKLIRGLIRAKCRYQTWNLDMGVKWGKYLKNLPLRFGALFCRKDKLVNRYEKLSSKDNSVNCETVFENGPDNYTDWCFPRDCLTGLMVTEFEGCTFTIPINYHEFLETAYGDYMQLPPESERGNQHTIVEVDFGSDA